MLISALLRMPELAEIPAVPPSGHTKLLFTADGKLLSLDQSGSQRQVFPVQAGLVVDVFNAGTGLQTWTKPTGCTHVEALLIAGGGGGSSGVSYPGWVSGTTGAIGGCGGNPGCVVQRSWPAALLPATVAMFVGVGGKGHLGLASPPAAATGGGAGGSGVATIFGYDAGAISTNTFAIAGAGTGGTNYYTPGQLTYPGLGSPAGGSNPTGAPGTQPLSPAGSMPYLITGGGGGGGGNVNSTGVPQNGGNGGFVWPWGENGARAAPGGSGGGDGEPGASTPWLVGMGGGGGAANLDGVRGGRGGDGGFFGGGGGGGGGSTYWGGPGGDGADGLMIVLSRR